MTSHYDYLHLALALAASRRGYCAPNPPVGAVVVKDDQIIATGYHVAAGCAHAEAAALANCGDVRGASIYVTLEPCCIWEKTPPCTDLLIARGIKKVFYGWQDPNPKVQAKGAAQLQAAGIDCQQLVSPAIAAFYQAYSYRWRTGLPWVIAKLAVSADAKAAGEGGQPLAITDQRVNIFTHRQRLKADAILTTARTVIYDDPQLNVRFERDIINKPLYVLDSKLSLSAEAKIFSNKREVTLFCSDTIAPATLAERQAQGLHCVPVKSSALGLDWQAVLSYIGKTGRYELWVEAGPTAFVSLMQSGLLQEAWLYQASCLLGSDALSAEKALAQVKQAPCRSAFIINDTTLTHSV